MRTPQRQPSVRRSRINPPGVELLQEPRRDDKLNMKNRLAMHLEWIKV